jgi:hypothetical protein
LPVVGDYGDAYQVMHVQISARLAALEAQRELAVSTDFPAENGKPRWFEQAEAK